ncbi:ChuX/HutX family heme-like substrate-binding protein [Synechococcus sp. PCC 6312]|uniref:ChuX/HutX family heme-like substrate-binding protein n=1 Tax=Synechococcus sp. (strain ATCC 27167 / PCC 6312) TaxID=195253 RepID=UPI00029F3B1D|nr:ChuX/HutX family heme-like substrate-binding protein [Synechococcus sp. PCC 6312]AFY60043.1 hypothetical protein Syn6312_0829 [Synechococcus sp. PCC 6312]
MTESSGVLDAFLADCESLGRLRLVVTNDVAVLEIQSPLTKVFYADLPQGRYANMHAGDFEFHLNLDQVIGVKFEAGQAKRGNFPTYAIRFMKTEDKPALSAFLQWGKPGEYAPGQVQAWETLREKYGDYWPINHPE